MRKLTEDLALIPLDEVTRRQVNKALSKIETNSAYRKHISFIDGRLPGAFIWERTDEGYAFWNNIDRLERRKR